MTRSFLETDWSPFEKEDVISIQLTLKTFLDYIKSGGRKLWPPRTSNPAYYFDNEILFQTSLSELGITGAKIEHFDHHETHAASVFLFRVQKLFGGYR